MIEGKKILFYVGFGAIFQENNYIENCIKKFSCLNKLQS